MTARPTQLSSYNPDGTTLGQDASDKISAYGYTPVAQRSGASQAAASTTASNTCATTAATSSSPYGYASGQANQIVTAVNSMAVAMDTQILLTNELRAALVALGFIKGS